GTSSTTMFFKPFRKTCFIIYLVDDELPADSLIKSLSWFFVEQPDQVDQYVLLAQHVFQIFELCAAIADHNCVAGIQHFSDRPSHQLGNMRNLTLNVFFVCAK